MVDRKGARAVSILGYETAWLGAAVFCGFFATALFSLAASAFESPWRYVGVAVFVVGVFDALYLFAYLNDARRALRVEQWQDAIGPLNRGLVTLILLPIFWFIPPLTVASVIHVMLTSPIDVSALGPITLVLLLSLSYPAVLVQVLYLRFFAAPRRLNAIVAE